MTYRLTGPGAIRSCLVIILPFVAISMSGCGSPASSPANGPNLSGLERSERSVGMRDERETTRRDVAIVNGVMLSQDDLWPRLAEYVGGEILEEVILDRRLASELNRRGIQLSDADIEAEEKNLLFLVVGPVAPTQTEAERVIQATRQARGLGPERYRALLRRNAMLRRLVQADVDVGEEEVQRLHAVRHGPKVRARIIVLPTERDAAMLRRKLDEQQDALRVAFAEAAMDESTDATSARGGLIETFSTQDPSYPAAARRALDQINVGDMTPVIGLEAGFAFLYLEDRLEPDGVTLEEARPNLLREVRLRRERVLMQDLAIELIGGSRVTPVDPGIGWSWAQRAETSR